MYDWTRTSLLFVTALTIVSATSGVYEVCLYAGTVEEVRFVRYTGVAPPPPQEVISKLPDPRSDEPFTVLMFVPLTRVSCFAHMPVSTYDLTAFCDG